MCRRTREGQFRPGKAVSSQQERRCSPGGAFGDDRQGAATVDAVHPAGPLSAHPAALAGPPVDWASLDRVLVVRLDNLGDVVLTGPLLRAVRAVLRPGATLDLLASPGGSAVATLLPWVDGVLTE